MKVVFLIIFSLFSSLYANEINVKGLFSGLPTNKVSIDEIIAVKKLVEVYQKDKGIQKQIIKSIFKHSENVNFDPMTLAAVLAKESSMRPNIQHDPVFVKIPTKRNWVEIKTAKVRAVGLGGVIFEIWKFELHDIGINSREELFTIDNNIRATAMILGIYTHERRQLKHTSSREESALLRYYGVTRDKHGIPNKTYSYQVLKIKGIING